MRVATRRLAGGICGSCVLLLSALAVVCGPLAQVQVQQAVRKANVQALNDLARTFDARFQKERAAAVQWAGQQRIPHLRIERPNGQTFQLMCLRDGRSVYNRTNNANAVDSVSTGEIQLGGSSGYDLDGTGVGLHIWDGGSVRTTHHELAGRVTLAEAVGLADHSTHLPGAWVQSTDADPQDGGATGHDTIPSQGNVKNILTVGAVSGMIVSRDPATGRFRAPTPGEYAALVQQAGDNRSLGFNRSTRGLVAEVRPDGAVGLRLRGRFLSSALARVGPDGAVVTGCATNETRAKSFFNQLPLSRKEGNNVK